MYRLFETLDLENTLKKIALWAPELGMTAYTCVKARSEACDLGNGRRAL